MTKQKDKDIADKVVAEIERRDVRMRSRAYFWLISLCLGVGVAAAFVTGLALVTLTALRLHLAPPFGFLRLGVPGVRPFLITFPWLPALVAATGITLGLWLLKRYDFSYKKNFLLIAVGVVALVVVVGAVVAQGTVRAKVHESHLAPLLHGPPAWGRNWVMGEVWETGPGELMLRTRQGRLIRVRGQVESLEVGQRVRAVGEWQGEVFFAKRIDGGHMLPPGRIQGKRYFERKGPPPL